MRCNIIKNIISITTCQGRHTIKRFCWRISWKTGAFNGVMHGLQSGISLFEKLI